MDLICEKQLLNGQFHCKKCVKIVKFYRLCILEISDSEIVIGGLIKASIFLIFYDFSMYTLLETCLERLDIFEFIAHMENGLKVSNFL